MELGAACWPAAVIRSARWSRSTCRLCWLSMLQCCGNSTLELITFGATELQRLAGRWPRRSSIGSTCASSTWLWGVTLAFIGRARGWRWGVCACECVCVCARVGRGVCFCSWPDPPFSHERTVENTVHKTVLADYQQLPSILRPTCWLKQPCLSLTTKMLLSLDKYLPLIFPSLNMDAADCELLQSII